MAKHNESVLGSQNNQNNRSSTFRLLEEQGLQAMRDAKRKKRTFYNLAMIFREMRRLDNDQLIMEQCAIAILNQCTVASISDCVRAQMSDCYE